jgi:endoglucanase
MNYSFQPSASTNLPEASWNRLPAWRGFNLLEKFTLRQAGPYREDDFRMISSLGFDFVRLPMDYRNWSRNGQPSEFDEACFLHIDDAVRWGIRYGIHVCLNFHRAPGYCVNPPAEATDLWTDKPTQDVCAGHWAYFAERYKEVPNRHLSFNLFNEPPGIDKVRREDYISVVKRMADAIRERSPDRLIIADGLNYGRIPLPELIPARIAQASRGYDPFGLTHFKAPWVKESARFPAPLWPVDDGLEGRGGESKPANAAELWDNFYLQWKLLEKAGSGVMIGEWGVFNRTPHAVTLAWMEDCLQLWKAAGWGWALWNFRGSFGVADNGRSDAEIEMKDGLAFDSRMLDLLRRY